MISSWTPERKTTSPQNPHGDGRYLPILDGWRAVAIMLVLLFHGFLNSQLDGPLLQAVGRVSARTGALGVLIFFCISGFLITQRLLAETRETGSFSLRDFYIKRTFRILPPLGVYLLTILVLFLFGRVELHSRDWSAPFFLANYFQGSWDTSHFWSLSVEEHFYLFWPACALLAGWRRSIWIGAALIVAVAVWRPWMLGHIDTGNLAMRAAYLQHTDLRVDYIMMGALVALCVEFYPRTLPALKRLGAVPNMLLLLTLLVLSTRPSSVDLRSVQAALLTLIVCCSTLAKTRYLRSVLTWKPVLFIGKISYSLYIWQQLVLARSPSPFWHSPLALPLKYVIALLLANLSFHFVERPAIRYGRSLIARHHPEQASATGLPATAI